MRIVSAAIVAAVFAASPASAQMMMGGHMHKSLYERLGGIDAIRAVVDDFVGNVAADKRINRFFANTDIQELHNADDEPWVGSENDTTPPVSGWLEARGIVEESTPNGDQILMGEAANEEAEASAT